VTEQKAWELLSIIDQIHLWGVTDFRDFVIQHLKPWHEFGKICYVNDIGFMNYVPEAGRPVVNDQLVYKLPRSCIRLPRWTMHFTQEACRKFEDRAAIHMKEAYINYHTDSQAMENVWSCVIGNCGTLEDGGYPLASLEEAMMHIHNVHEEDDDAEESRMPSLPIRKKNGGDTLQESRRRQKRPYEDLLDAEGIQLFKKRKG